MNTTTAPHHRRTTRRSAGATLVALAIAAGAWASTGTTAQAPEPAKLKAALPATTGASASAIFVTSQQPTTVRYYIGSWSYDLNGPAAGTPCSSSSLVADATTYQRIQVALKPDGTPTAYHRCA